MTLTLDLSEASEQLLYAVKLKKSTTQLEEYLKSIKVSRLIKELENDDLKKAFWINIYNAQFQIIRNNKLATKDETYKKKVIKIADEKFSLDDIEHGILRRYRYKYSLGLFPNPFTRRTIKKLAVDKIDYRIHFALNCGAESCPPIAFYNFQKIEAQLDMATQSFLDGETRFDIQNKTIYTSQLLNWFRYDFGGKKGIEKMYLTQLNKDIKGFTLKYNDYSWNEKLDNFV